MIRFLINIYTWIVLADVLLSYVPQYQNQQWAKTVKKIAGYSLNPVRKLLPSDLPFDFSPVVVLIILQLLPSLW
jgi:YggT family protein